ncbi:TPA: hypothetical protein ACUQ9V_004812, partial [Escherichia coli]
MTVLTAGSVSDKICRYASSIMAPASPPARRSQTETTDTSRCRSSSLRVIRAPEEKPNMAYLLLTATQKKGLQGSGQG